MSNGMQNMNLAILCRTSSRKRRPADAVQTTRKSSKKAFAAASPRGPVAIHQGLGMELPSVQVENMDEDGHTEAAIIPVSAFASASEPHASLAATRPVAANHPNKSATPNEPKRRRGRPPKANPLPERASVPTPSGVLEPHRPVRKSAKSARPAELLSIPKQSKADLINWSTTATANKRIKACGPSAKVSGNQASSPVARRPCALAGLQAGSHAEQACRDNKDIRVDQLPAAILRPFWPTPSQLLPDRPCPQRPSDQHNSAPSSQQTQHHPPALADVNDASQPAVANVMASDAVDAANAGTESPDTTHVASSGSLPQQPARQQQPPLQLPDAREQPQGGAQKQDDCTAEEIDTAARKLAALLQGPQPLLSGVVHAFGHAICACSAVFPACAAAWRQLGTEQPAPQGHQSDAADHDAMVSPELHPLAPVWLSRAALSRFSLTALLHLACRVDELSGRPAQKDADQHQIPDPGAQQASGQVQKSAGIHLPPSATRQGVFLGELRRHLHFKALATLAAAHCGLPRNRAPAHQQSNSEAAAGLAPAFRPISSLADISHSWSIAQCSLPPVQQCVPNAALDAVQEPSCRVSTQGRPCAALSADTCTAAMQGSTSAAAAATCTAAVQLAAPTSPLNPSETSAQPDTEADVGGLQCTDAAVDKLASVDAAIAPATASASLIQPPPMPASTGPSEASEGGQQGTASSALQGLQGLEDVIVSVAAVASPASIQRKLFSANAAAAQGLGEPDSTPPNLPSSSAPAAQSAPLDGLGWSQAGFVTNGAGHADKADGASSSSPPLLGTLDSQYAAVLCLASSSLCKILGNRQVSRHNQRLPNRQHAWLVQLRIHL